MAVNKPTGDNARKGAVRKRSQTKTTLAGTSAWTKRDRSSGEFMALKRPGKKKRAIKKFKGVRIEKRAAKKKKAKKSGGDCGLLGRPRFLSGGAAQSSQGAPQWRRHSWVADPSISGAHINQSKSIGRLSAIETTL